MIWVLKISENVPNMVTTQEHTSKGLHMAWEL